MQIKPTLAGAARRLQDCIRPKSARVQCLLVVLQNQLDKAAQRDVHLVGNFNIAIKASLTSVNILAGRLLHDAPQ